jgi:Tfp pilus assembly protein PilV
VLERSRFRVKLSRRRGFSLVEVMGAVVILTLALFAVISVNAYILKSTVGSENRQIANTIACNQLAVVESILKVNFRAPSADIATPVLQSSQFPKFSFRINDLGYEDPQQTLRAVSVQVQWEEKGENRVYEIDTTFYGY